MSGTLHELFTKEQKEYVDGIKDEDLRFHLLHQIRLRDNLRKDRDAFEKENNRLLGMIRNQREDIADDIKFISEPLLTEEGFLNINAVNELNNKILNLPKTFERLLYDSEWTRKRWTFKHDIVGAFAKFAIIQSPYNVPKGLEFVCNFLSLELDKFVKWENAGMTELSLCDINKILYDILYEKGIEPFDNWNKCEIGETPDIVSASRFDSRPNPDHDFIDLDALLHNVCLDIRMERRDFDTFNENYEHEHPNELL